MCTLAGLVTFAYGGPATSSEICVELIPVSAKGDAALSPRDYLSMYWDLNGERTEEAELPGSARPVLQKACLDASSKQCHFTAATTQTLYFYCLLGETHVNFKPGNS